MAIPKLRFICPVCNSEKILEVPISIITQAKDLVPIFIPRGLVCDHQFQALIDKNFMIHGYQLVDYEFEKLS